MEHKYEYTLNGRIYFVSLSCTDKEKFENRYGVMLRLVD